MNLMEIHILDWIQNHLANQFLDASMPLITRLADKGFFWILLALLLLLIPKTRKLGVAMALAIVIEFLVTDVTLKHLVARTRPYDINTSVQLLIPKQHDFSFPSGHTGVSFAAAASLCYNKNKFGIWAMILAAIIAFSRLYLYVHYPTDILFGICWGICAGCLGGFLAEKYYH